MQRLSAGCAVLALLFVCPPLAAEDNTELVSRAGLVSLGGAAGIDGAAPPATPVSLTEPPGAIALGTSLAGWEPPAPPITLVLQADLSTQRLTVVENGKTIATWLISSGRAGYATSKGTFRPQWMAKMWYSRQYEWSPMPHAVFFNRGTAFHGTSAVGMLGRPASHGCVRLHPSNAAQLFKLVSKHGIYQTKVVVHGGSKSSDPAVASRQRKGSKQKVAQARRGSPYAAPAEPSRRRVARGSGRTSSSYGSPYGSPWSW
jgi:hypothetical protein